MLNLEFPLSCSVQNVGRLPVTHKSYERRDFEECLAHSEQKYREYQGENDIPTPVIS